MNRAPPVAPSFRSASRFWWWLGFVSFGGPAGQIAIMHRELVERRRWISEQRFLHALNYCMLLPGPEAQQLATYIGWLLHGMRGALTAGGLFVLPSFFVLTLLSWIYMAYGHLPAVAAVLYGVKPAVTAIVAFAAWRIGSRALRNAPMRAIAVAAFLAIFALRLPFPLIILGAAVIGFAGSRIKPAWFSQGGAHAAAQRDYGPALIDDDTPPPVHARFGTWRFARVVAAGLALWVLALGALWWSFDGGSLPLRMGGFFTGAALLTFGGAYAVLPYVYQAAVAHYGWLTAPQMIDGLALGETTPGPLIMIVTFVGFAGGWTRGVAGIASPLAAGALCAGVATFFTFLPSFLFILAGGPLVEATHGEIKFTAPLSAITAAVVGVVLNLAVFFAWHVLWPHGFGGGFEWPAAMIGLAALIALIHFRAGIMPLIGACALAGLAVRWLAT
ncbi:MAG: chromate efflux transporter [Gammaproteobacteria bacterium]|nr:chromate efflux transporter [Gammaproteobacteria bacterium]